MSTLARLDTTALPAGKIRPELAVDRDIKALFGKNKMGLKQKVYNNAPLLPATLADETPKFHTAVIEDSLLWMFYCGQLVNDIRF